MPKINFHVSEDKTEIEEKLCNFISSIHSNLKQRYYVLPGGSSPVGFYKKMAERKIDWSNTKIVLSDERLVDRNDDRSNEKSLRKYLIDNIKYGINQPEFIDIESLNIENYKPDFTLLGIGIDGHTASLFPNNSEIFSLSPNTYIYKTKIASEDFERITLTFKFILKSKHIAFLVLGAEKKKVLKEVINGNYNPVKYPSQYILNNFNRDIEIFCDKEAFGCMKT